MNALFGLLRASNDVRVASGIGILISVRSCIAAAHPAGKQVPNVSVTPARQGKQKGARSPRAPFVSYPPVFCVRPNFACATLDRMPSRGRQIIL